VGVAAHILGSKYGLTKFWNVIFLPYDYTDHALKGIYVKLYIENFLWYIVKCRYSRFFSIFLLKNKASGRKALCSLLARYGDLNNLRDFEQKKLLFRSKLLPGSRFLYKVYYKDFVFSWFYLKHLFYRRLGSYNYNFLKQRFSLKLPQIPGGAKLKLLYLFKLKKTVFKNYQVSRFTRGRRKLGFKLKRKKYNRKAKSKTGRASSKFYSTQIKKLKKTSNYLKEKFKYGLSLSFYKNLNLSWNMPKNQILLYRIGAPRKISRQVPALPGSYKLSAYFCNFTNGSCYLHITTSVAQKLYFLSKCFSIKLRRNYRLFRDFFYLFRQLLILKLERVLTDSIGYCVRIYWQDLSNSLLYNKTCYLRELTRRRILSVRVLRKWRVGYVQLVNTMHAALFWGSSLLIANLFYEKLTNTRSSLSILYFLFNVLEILLKTIIYRKNVIILVSGVFKKGAKKQKLSFNMFGAKFYNALKGFCNYSQLTCATRTGTVGFKIFVV